MFISESLQNADGSWKAREAVFPRLLLAVEFSPQPDYPLLCHMDHAFHLEFPCTEGWEIRMYIYVYILVYIYIYIYQRLVWSEHKENFYWNNFYLARFSEFSVFNHRHNNSFTNPTVYAKSVLLLISFLLGIWNLSFEYQIETIVD